MDVAHKLQQITLAVTQNGFVPALKEMPNLSIPPVIVSGIAKLQVLHDLGKRYSSNLRQQMDVIPHQYVGIQLPAVSGLYLLEQRKVSLTVSIIVENHLTLVSTTDDVIKSSREMNTRFPRHEVAISRFDAK